MTEIDELDQLDQLLSADIETCDQPLTYEFNEKLSGSSNPNQSAIHNGDTDSSDDEERRNCIESTYSEYGQGIKKILDQQENEKLDKKLEFKIRLREANSDVKKVKLKQEKLNTFIERDRNDKNVLCAPEVKQKEKFDVYTCPIFNIRITKPLISSGTFLERLQGREAISMLGVRRHVETGDLAKDWVIAGVIVRKSGSKESQKGSKFTIWTLSDLKNDMKSCTLFLFRKAYNDYWKTDVGTVVAILNPSPLDKRDDNSSQATLSIDTPDKIMILGQSKDYGLCKSKKKNGEPCNAFVNLNECEHCIFHVKNEYQKFSRRQELQSSTMGKGLVDLRNKVLGKNTVIYGGREFKAVPGKNKKVLEHDKNRLMSLSDYYKTESDKLIINQAPYGSSPIAKSNSNPLLNRKQGDITRLGSLDASSSPKPGIINNISTSANNLSQLVASSSKLAVNKPKIGVGLNRSGVVDLNINYTSKAIDRAKENAIHYIKMHGGIKKSNPHNLKGSELGKKRALETLVGSSSKKVKTDIDIKLNGIKSERFKKILEATSAHQNLIEKHDDDEKEKYFNKLEKKEAMEEKMLNTYKLPCKGVRCTKCKYTSFSAADLCKQERHPLKVFDTVKRFFKCGDCNNRTVTLELIPLHSCKNCSSSRWVKAPMIREKNGVTSETLSIRGEEESHIGADVVCGKNINLLVPE